MILKERTNKMEKGTLVKIKRQYCNSDQEANLVFKVVEDRDSMVLIQDTRTDYAIQPTENINKEYVEAVQ